jgi:hypothetical protein
VQKSVGEEGDDRRNNAANDKSPPINIGHVSPPLGAFDFAPDYPSNRSQGQWSNGKSDEQ